MAEPPPRSPHFVRVVHTTGGVIRSYTHLAKHPCPSNTVRDLYGPCVIVAKRPCTSTRIMSLYKTERRPNNNLMYTVDQTFGYHSQKFICACAESSAHAPATKIRGGKFKYFKTLIQGQGSFTKRGLLQGDTTCNMKGVQHIYTKFSKCNSYK